MSLSPRAALLVCAALCVPSAAWAGEASVGAALGLNYGVGQSSKGYDEGTDTRIGGLPSISGAVLVRRDLSDWSALRAGLRGGYVQDMALVTLAGAPVETRDAGGVDIEIDDENGSILVAHKFLGLSVGGEIFLRPANTVRPYFLGEVGAALGHQHVLARAGKNSNTTCAVSPNCSASSGGDPTDTTGDGSPDSTASEGDNQKESTRLTGGPVLTVGVGVALPDPSVRFELAYMHTVTLESTWGNAGSYLDGVEVQSPTSSVGVLEFSVGYVFGGG